MAERDTITSACPTCGTVAERHVYDIGSGPELSCASCEWCWGAEGQDLQPLGSVGWMANATTEEVRHWAQNQAIQAGRARIAEEARRHLDLDDDNDGPQ